MLSNGDIFYPAQIHAIHCKYVLSSVNKYNPTRKRVIQGEYLLFKMKTCYQMQQISIQCDNYTTLL